MLRTFQRTSGLGGTRGPGADVCQRENDRVLDLIGLYFQRREDLVERARDDELGTEAAPYSFMTLGKARRPGYASM